MPLVLPNPLSGPAYRWGNAGNLTLAAAFNQANRTAWIPVADVQQVNALFEVSLAATTLEIYMLWSSDAVDLFWETVDQVGTVSGPVLPFDLLIKTWAVDPSGLGGVAQLAIPRPVCAHYVAYYVRTAAAPGVNDYVQLTLERQAQGQLGAVGS